MRNQERRFYLNKGYVVVRIFYKIVIANGAIGVVDEMFAGAGYFGDRLIGLVVVSKFDDVNKKKQRQKNTGGQLLQQ